MNPVINGVSFWENPHALFSSGLSPEVIETVNVMTGGFSAEYGNRFGGVLDVVTKSGSRMDDDGSIAVTVGGADRRRISGEFGGHRGRLGYYVFGSGATTGRFLSPPHPEAVHDDGVTGRGFFQLDVDLGNAGSIRSVLTADASNLEIPKHPSDLVLRPGADAEQRTRQQSAIVSWTRPWTRTLAAASLYQRWSSARLFPADGPLTATARHDRWLRTLGAKIDVTRLFGTHAVKAGLDAVQLRPEEDLFYDYSGFREYTHLQGQPHIHFNAGSLQFAARETGGQLSAYVQDAIRLGGRLSADVGVRIDRYAVVVSATHASPRINVAAHLPGETVLHASYNHFFVPPPAEGLLSSSAGLTSQISEVGTPLGRLRPTTEDQFELGAATTAGPLRLALTGYYRDTDNPVHTTVWPDSRIYSYASFDRARAFGLEAKAEAPQLARYGVTGFVNYALGRVDFYNPVTGGFITEAAHVFDTNRFPAPMDQTHTVSAGATYRNPRTGLWIGTAAEYGSGTPMGHGGGHGHDGDPADHDHPPASPAATVLRVPAHFTLNVSVGGDLLRDSRRRARLSLRLDIENVTDDVYLIAQEGEFSPAQYAIPRLVPVTARFRF